MQHTKVVFSQDKLTKYKSLNWSQNCSTNNLATISTVKNGDYFFIKLAAPFSVLVSML